MNTTGFCYDYSRYDHPGLTSHAQEGEDIILCKLFALGGCRVKRNGFYVDVGAHHPMRYSTTFLFHQRFCWTGVNIDPNPGSKALFDEHRPADINLEIGVSCYQGMREFHLFDDPALNTFDAGYARVVQSWNTRQYLGVRQTPVQTLAGVFAEHVGDREVDLLNIDVEGHELAVLSSGDWARHRPHVVLVESLERTFDTLPEDPAFRFMDQAGYCLRAKTCSTLIFCDRRWQTDAAPAPATPCPTKA